MGWWKTREIQKNYHIMSWDEAWRWVSWIVMDRDSFLGQSIESICAFVFVLYDVILWDPVWPFNPSPSANRLSTFNHSLDFLPSTHYLLQSDPALRSGSACHTHPTQSSFPPPPPTLPQKPNTVINPSLPSHNLIHSTHYYALDSKPQLKEINELAKLARKNLKWHLSYWLAPGDFIFWEARLRGGAIDFWLG
jgi:hypothetical protein